MKAAFIRRTGPAPTIEYGDLPDPQITASQCLVEVGAVDVNPIDVYVRSGLIPANLTFPYILGRDLARKVVQVGEGVKHFRVRERGVGDQPGHHGPAGNLLRNPGRLIKRPCIPCRGMVSQ